MSGPSASTFHVLRVGLASAHLVPAVLRTQLWCWASSVPTEPHPQLPFLLPPFLSNPTFARFSFLAHDVYASGLQYLSRSASTQRSLDTSFICTVLSIILYHELLLPLGCHLHTTISICLHMLSRRKSRIYVLKHASPLSSSLLCYYACGVC